MTGVALLLLGAIAACASGLVALTFKLGTTEDLVSVLFRASKGEQASGMG